MCNLSQGIEARGFAKGFARGYARGFMKGYVLGYAKGRKTVLMIAIKGLMDSTGVSREQAMTALKIPEDERPKYMRLLDQQSC